VSWAETDGTFTNLERRVQRAPKALANPHSQAVSDWSIFVHLAQRWPGIDAPQAGAEGKDKKSKKKGEGLKPWAHGTAQAVLEEIGRAVPQYDKISWASLGDEGKQAPWDLPRSDAGRGVEVQVTAPRRLAVPQRQVSPAPTKDFSYALVTGRVLFDGGTLFRQTEGAQGVAASVAVSMHPDDAVKEGLVDGQSVTVSSPNGQLILALVFDERVQPGTVWIPVSLPGAPVETLTGQTGEPVGIAVRGSQKVG
jgi:predicted molibdopterin-dependent oxidoreductase YjgC